MSIFTELLFMDGFIATPKALEAVEARAVEQADAAVVAGGAPVSPSKRVSLRQAAVVCQLCG